MEATSLLSDTVRHMWMTPQILPPPPAAGLPPPYNPLATSPLDHIKQVAQWYASVRDDVPQQNRDAPFLQSRLHSQLPPTQQAILMGSPVDITANSVLRHLSASEEQRATPEEVRSVSRIQSSIEDSFNGSGRTPSVEPGRPSRRFVL